MTSAPTPGRTTAPATRRPERPTTATRPRPAALRHVVGWLLRQHLRYVAWATAVLVAGAVVATLVVDRFSDVDISIVQHGRQGFVWFPFALAIILVTTYQRVHVAAGMTRRVLARATILTGVLTGAVYTAVMVAALQVERVLYGARGWAQQITDTAPLFEDTSEVGLMLVDLGLLFVAAQLSGLLVGSVYQRFGGWWGTLSLPLTVGPVFAMPALLLTTWLDPLGLPVRVLLAVAVLVACAAAYAAVLSGTRIRPVAT